MWRIYSIFILVTLAAIPHLHHAEFNNAEVFKLKKYNDIWERALGKTMSQQKLVQLRKLLVKFDRLELEEKHRDAEERNDGEQPRSSVEGHLNAVLEEYDLLNRKEADFIDGRLNELWRHAVKQGDYSATELQNLHTEMQHMDAKLNRVQNMGMEAVGNSVNTLEDNMVHGDDVKVGKPVDEERLELKMKLMKDSILSKKKSKPQLKDHRVQELWDTAQGGSFSEDELGTIREELSHFQKYVDKMEHWEGVHSHLKNNGGEESELLRANERLTKYKHKVKKFHKTMLAKIEGKTEL